MFEKILQFKLKIIAKLILRKYRPSIIGITGSIGKTSTKEAIVQVLNNKLRVRGNLKNYNNEIGLPLTVIGLESPGANIFGWIKVFFYSLGLILFKDKKYPEVLVLELGIDRPGDMDYLMSIVKINVGIVTSVSYSHLEYFGSLNNIKKEKQVLIEQLDSQGLAIINFDNAPAREMLSASKARVLTYGLNNGANLQAQDIIYNYTRGNYELTGINFKLNYDGSIVPVFMKNIMSESALYATLAAAAVGIYFNYNLLDIAESLSDFTMPPGRMSLLPGIKHSFIIDDTYNSSPEAALAALETLRNINVDKSADKYAVLGDMLEIGTYTEEGHLLVGKKVAESGIKHLIAVGERARDFIRGAKEAGMEDDYIFYFDNPEEAGRFLQNRIKEGDILLVKGSQGARMEKIVKELMAEPERATELLARQEDTWKNT